MPPPWPRNELKLQGLDLDAVLRETGLAMQREQRMPPMAEMAIRENCIRKARIRLDGPKVRVEDAGDAYSLFDHADWAKLDFVEFEAYRLVYIDAFEARLQQAVDRLRTGGGTGPSGAPAP